MLNKEPNLNYIINKIPESPIIGIVLGSGLGKFIFQRLIGATALTRKNRDDIVNGKKYDIIMDEEISIIDTKTRNEKIKNFFVENKKLLLSIVVFLLI